MNKDTNTTDWTARQLRHDDIGALRTIIDANQLFPSDMLDDMTSPYLVDPDGEERWFVIEDQVPVGVAYSAPERMTDGTFNLLLIAVHPDHQGRGIGKALMRAAEEDLVARGARILLVETSGLDAFERPRSFYSGIGYGEEARIRDYYASGEDKVTFRKEL